MAVANKTQAKIKSFKLGQFVTPVGSALFVSSPNPSQYDSEKEEGSIILSADDWATVKGQIDAALKANEAELPVPIASMKYPVKDATDGEGNPTGEFILKAKTSIKYPAKFYDTDGKPFVPDAGFNVPNRSKIRLSISFEVVSTSLYKGIVARLNAIKVISATPWSGANPFGDTQDEGDYMYTPAGSTPQEDDQEQDWVD